MGGGTAACVGSGSEADAHRQHLTALCLYTTIRTRGLCTLPATLYRLPRTACTAVLLPAQAALALDPSYGPMLERIESVYLRPRGGGGFGGPLGGLLGSLLGGDMMGEMGGEVEEEEEEEHFSDPE